VSTDQDEEKLLRSVALQNAQSILAARQRAEEELLRAKKELESKTGELKNSVAMMRATLEAATDGILVTDGRGHVTGFNERYVDLWQIPREIIDSRDHRRILELCSRQFTAPREFLAEVERIYASSQPETMDLLQLADGRVYERLSRTQVVAGKNVGRVWSFRDITERKRGEEVSSRLAAIVQSSDDAIVSKTLDGIITTWNLGAQRVFGYSADEVIGKSITLLIPPERASEEPAILQRLRQGERIEPYETMRIRKDGTLLDISLTVSPIKDAGGKVIGAAKIARDITARKNAAREMERLLDSERAARTEAERVSLLKDEFLATLSHELRTPLNAILGWSQLLQTSPGINAELEEGLLVIERNTKVQTQLIEDLLDMSRIISGKIRLDVQRVDLQDVINAAVASVRHSADAKDIRLQVVLDPHAGPVRGDPDRLQQCFWNLLSNAIKFTPKGGKVQIRLERVDSHIEVCVVDDGQGISPQFLPHVFERFRQEDASTTRRYGGLGLGLSIVKHFVELHGGTVRATSAGEGKGATFCIELPLTVIHNPEPDNARAHPRGRRGPAAAPDHPSLAGISVLAVDDELDARILLKRVLEECGARVFVAASAIEGLAILQRELPDMIISDIGMPGQDGYEFIKHVRKLRPEEGGKTPAAALTAFARAEDRTRALRAGYQSHVAKPVEPTELTAVVASLATKR
jgi:PAS domain S-box-containing protein